MQQMTLVQLEALCREARESAMPDDAPVWVHTDLDPDIALVEVAELNIGKIIIMGANCESVTLSDVDTPDVLIHQELPCY